MAMTTAQGTTAIETALDEELAEFGKERAEMTFLKNDDTFDINVALALKIKTRLLVDLDGAWSD